MPFITSHNIVFGRPLAALLVARLSVGGAAALLVTPFVHLFTAGPSPITPLTLPADFTEATFVGYAPIALPLPLLGPVNLAFDDLGAHEEVDFLAGAVVPPGENILGYWIDEAAVGGLVMYLGETFEDPVPIALAGDFISLDATFAIAMRLTF